jgi:hypothetical protein
MQRSATEARALIMEAQPEYLTVSQAAKALGISPRAVQKRCANGTLAARRVSTPAGDRWEVEGANLPANLDASWTRTDEPTGREPREPDASTAAGLNSKPCEPTREQDANPRTIGREQDANTRELLAQSREEILFLRGMVEQHQRSEAELRASLRAALAAMPKAITAGDNVSTPGGPEKEPVEAATARASTPDDQTVQAAKQSPQRGTQRQKLTAFQRAVMRVIGAR